MIVAIPALIQQSSITKPSFQQIRPMADGEIMGSHAETMAAALKDVELGGHVVFEQSIVESPTVFDWHGFVVARMDEKRWAGFCGDLQVVGKKSDLFCGGSFA